MWHPIGRDPEEKCLLWARDETWGQAAPPWDDRDGSAGVCAWGLGMAWDLGLEPVAWS